MNITEEEYIKSAEYIKAFAIVQKYQAQQRERLRKERRSFFLLSPIGSFDWNGMFYEFCSAVKLKNILSVNFEDELMKDIKEKDFLRCKGAGKVAWYELQKLIKN